jgi:hypothetical protein
VDVAVLLDDQRVLDAIERNVRATWRANPPDRSCGASERAVFDLAARDVGYW